MNDDVDFKLSRSLWQVYISASGDSASRSLH